MLRYFLHFVHGLGIGVANVIPGVSGGTMALLFGIYERIIGAASGAVRTGLTLVSGDFRGALARARALPWALLLPLMAGALAAPFLGAGLLSRLLDAHPQIMRGLFVGLIVGSLPIPWVRIGTRDGKRWGLLLAATIAAWLLSSLPPAGNVDPALWQVFLAASVAITAMVLPGVSGAYLLLVLGFYQATLVALESLDIAFILVFAAGAGFGLGVFSLALNWLLENRHDSTMAALVGLMVGSLRALWPWQDMAGTPHLPAGGDTVSSVLLLGALGLLVTGALSWWELRSDRTANEAT